MPGRKLGKHTHQESTGILFSFGSGLVWGLLANILLQNQSSVLFGGGLSVSALLAASATVSAVVGFGAGYRFSAYRTHRPKTTRHKLRKYVSVAALIFASAAIAYLTVTVATYAIAQFVGEIRIAAPAVIAMVATISMLSTYVVFLQATQLSTLKLVGFLTVFMASGALASMLTTQDHTWWQIHFSQLGSSRGGAVSSYAFNLTMIIGGLIVSLLADFILNDLQHIQHANPKYAAIRANVVRGLLIAVGVGMIGVGLVPYDRIRIVHDISANLTTASFAMLVVTLPWLMPMFSRVFFGASYVFVLAGVFCYWLALKLVISLTTMELLVILLFFSWLVLFIRQINAIYADEVHSE